LRWDLKRQSNGKILPDHYRYQRRRSAGDERLCHQPVTVMRREIKMARRRVSSPGSQKRQAPAPLGGKMAPKPCKVTVSSDTIA
jgi:hypothetical protein